MAAVREHPDELRADLQRYYGIDLDHAMNGEHTAGHIASLVVCLPSDAALFRTINPDAAWTLQSVLLAAIFNNLTGLIYGMSDKRKRGSKPKRIGPSWIVNQDKRKLDARPMSITELMAELSKPRR